ncbi:MAG: nickel pincer cofactor biosynthesis protein LarB [SAR324 cluster bacterium]|nr:nickel pincer cofactor biosynthesis protein LarB [SAR324 cluster bacterium]
MQRQDMLSLLERIKNGELSAEEATQLVERETYQDLGFAKLDHQRMRRLGFPEVVFAEGKAPGHLLDICRAHRQAQPKLLVTRLAADIQEIIAGELPGGHYNATAHTLSYGLEQARAQGQVLVLCAGTSDLPVAEEALETARLMDCQVELIADLGVAGMHRLLDHQERIAAARVIVVVAGMEGALPSVVGGLSPVPLIAVPTSVGYGASFGGVAALLAMLNSCAPGVSVVNIDNGFGAGYCAALINNAPAGE